MQIERKNREKKQVQLKEVTILPEPENGEFMLRAKLPANDSEQIGVAVLNTLQMLKDEQTVRTSINGIPARIVGFDTTETGKIDWIINIYSEDINQSSPNPNNTSW